MASLTSKKLCFVLEGDKYELPTFSTKMSSHDLVVVDDHQTKYYLPTTASAVDSVVDNYLRYFYNSQKPTIKIGYSSGVIKVFNDWTDYYDIPEGTYTPSNFETLIKQFISNNGYRTTKNAFKVTVNGQTISVAANKKVYYTVCSSSPQGLARTVWFNPSSTPSSSLGPAIEYNNSSNGFTNGHAYVVFFSYGGFQYASQAFSSYRNYPITVTTGINFT